MSATLSKNSLKGRLAVMNFLEFAVWGSYLVSMGIYLSSVGLMTEIFWFYTVQGLVSLVMPALVGIIADRWVPAQKMLSLCHLLAGLFLPLDDKDATAFVQVMASRGKDGLWGLDACYTRRFDRHLRYLYEAHGLQQAAEHPVSSLPAFAPFAAALALPFCPRQAVSE